MKTTYYFILNLFLAIAWIILNNEAGIFHFLLGFAIGFFILWIFQYSLHSPSYIKRMKGFIKFIFVFMGLFLQSNIDVATLILFVPKNKMNPAFISYQVEDLSHLEALLISQFISLTPGSVSVNLEKNILHVHLLNLKDLKQAFQDIDKLKQLILGFTR